MSTHNACQGKLLSQLFPEEKLGWRGYVEWEDHPEKKVLASEILRTKKFTPIPEFQLVPLPKTNPILIGHRWKEYHEALGLKSIVDFSWETVLKEKPGMIHLLDFPYNGETPRIPLLENKITDNKWHFVRNHGGIPDIDEDAFELEIGGLVNNPVKLSMKDLKDASRFPHCEVTVTLQCSGTRRIEQIREYPGDGDELINAPWGEGAIGTAVYRGVPLKKVLKIACGGIKPEAQHLEFIGADTYFKKGNVFNYAVSVPWRKVRQNEEVLLAWEMNGAPLPKIHGFPLRMVITGVIAWDPYSVRNICITLLRSESTMLNIRPGSRYRTCLFRARSSSLSTNNGGGNWVERVEVSNDGGHVWYAVEPDDLTEKHYHTWRLWKIRLPVDAEGWLEFCVRTWDSSNNTEPTYVRSAWNWDLHVTSSAHRIKVYSVNKSRPATAARLAEIAARGETIEPITRPMEWSLEDPVEYLAAVRKHPENHSIELRGWKFLLFHSYNTVRNRINDHLI
ncbi:Sulfite oxidase [Grifola frondosa]|uniref:Sulfite oxidase n=1 Tax=Grifola frondosa TaxID=5627 RepID=A0A1C7LWI8_GRIFR|nr:Sulfite oxidase [Grifola frondosa]